MKIFTALVFILGSAMAYAEGSMGVPNHAKWKDDCGSCHIAYPPQLLTSASWASLMGSLDKHFGAVAVMDEKENKDILEFLQRNAGKGNRYSSLSMRVSDTPWFKREHREIQDTTWKDKAVKSPANCTACHVDAAKGDWSEDGVRMPGESQKREGD